ncbi:trigger factor [Anaeropeptidivorans aminofermentans]|uniref:trigger factor n=1 Tax=Anaeropeptidivorans aminofermentans TaxID=2934315 RepID=UPI002024AC7D|nr:trigger factor [Anaeropeptidivorans aminofermentans]MBE6012993.1 trigger factor [Lachnospiraceae bacterium]
MGSRFETVETNKVKITFEISPEKFEEGIQEAYKRNRGKINIPGFRKGKAPRKIIEMNFGKEIFYEDAVNIVLPDAYDSAVKELNLDTVSRPEIDIEEISAENGVVLTAEVFVKPEVSIEAEDYKGVQYEIAEAVIEDSEIEAEINKVREQNARIVPVTDRPVQDGDIVTLDFEGFVDGVAFEGGKGENYELTIGSKTFIDTFEEQLTGLNIGEEKDVNVKFPEEYGKEELNGKPALFKVKINGIKFKELPEADDDLAQDVSEFDTLDEYKNSIKEKLLSAKEEEIKNKKENDIVKAVTEKAKMDVPPVMIENQIENMVNDFANQLRMQGLPLETYLQYVGQDMDSLREAYRANAENQVKSRLVLEAIANKEGFPVTEEDIDAELNKLAENYQMEKERLENILRPEDKEGLKKDIAVRKALDYIVENAVGQ